MQNIVNDIKYLDIIPLPKSYKVYGNSGKIYKSINRFVKNEFQNRKNRYTKRKYKNKYPFVTIVNTSVRYDTSIYFNNSTIITKNDIELIIRNSKYINLYFSKDFSEVIFVSFSENDLDYSYLDPAIYFDNEYIELKVPYNTDFNGMDKNINCFAFDIPYTMKNLKSKDGIIIFAYIFHNYMLYEIGPGEIVFVTEAFTTDVGCAPVHAMKKNINIRKGKNRYMVTFINHISNTISKISICYVDADDEKKAKQTFIEDANNSGYNFNIKSIIKIPDNEWF